VIAYPYKDRPYPYNTILRRTGRRPAVSPGLFKVAIILFHTPEASCAFLGGAGVFESFLCACHAFMLRENRLSEHPQQWKCYSAECKARVALEALPPYVAVVVSWVFVLQELTPLDNAPAAQTCVIISSSPR
jgi:hypothetical protein